MAPRVAMLSIHTSPLAQPGAGDGGGMNVYVRSLGEALARAGVGCDVLTRAEQRDQRGIVELEPGLRVVYLDAGPRRPVAKHELVGLLDELVDAARAHLECGRACYEALHANYWISGAVGHRLKHELDLPLAATFHTWARTKTAAGVTDDPTHRQVIEAEVLRCADVVVASTPDEAAALSAEPDADRDRVEIIPPGVDHALFSPSEPRAARRRLGLPTDRPLLLFVGRIQPLKGVDVAVRALAALRARDAELVVVGGPSGADGPPEVARLRALAEDLGVTARVRWVRPVPHDRLADWYRAADVCLVPSRSESFGLVALEAAACGTPVVAANVGGLRTLVDHDESGFLVDGRDPDEYAAPIQALLDAPGRAAAMGSRAAARAGRYTWSIAAARLRRLYADLAVRALVQCT
ncbi:MAG TPA: glycosyltransferase [Acidimicrobiia bacterium]|nr:glycosyltransferase [Acidimicrobiia bacterium]